MKLFNYAVIIILFSIIIACSSEKTKKDSNMFESKIAQYAKTDIKYDDNLLDENQKIVVQRLFEAAKCFRY